MNSNKTFRLIREFPYCNRTMAALLVM